MDESIAGIIEKRSLAEQVYVYLCNSIISGRFNYGQTISTKQLAAELNVSMMPIREALKRLELEGIIEIKPRSMCVFRTPTRETILSAISVRELLEIYCVKSTYNTLNPERLNILKEITEDMSAALKNSPEADLKQYIHLDWRFHISLCALADNVFIDKTYRELNLHLNMYYMYDIGIKPDTDQIYKDHLDLIHAMAKRDPKAVDIIERHLKTSRQNILRGKFFSQE